MAALAFDNNGGGGDNIYDTNTNWIGNVVPVTGDSAIMAADATCDSDESGNVLIAMTINAGVTLTVSTGGTIYVEDGDVIPATGSPGGVLNFDGGTFRATATTNTDRDIKLLISTVPQITATANGGTLEMDSQSGSNNVQIETQNSTSLYAQIVGDPASRLDIVAVTNPVRVFADEGQIDISHVHFDGVSIVEDKARVKLTNCIIENVTTGITVTTLTALVNSYIYGTTQGLSLQGGKVEADGTVFGETEAAVPDPNTTADILVTAQVGRGELTNCKLSSSTPLRANRGWGTIELTSERHDQEAGEWARWFGSGINKLSPEDGAGAHGGSGRATKIETAAGLGVTGIPPLLVEVARFAANQDDVVDVTIYVKGTNGKTGTIHLDPYSIFGTTQKFDFTATGSYVQLTISTYTVSIGAGFNAAIPVYFETDEASEVFFVDTLEAVLT